MLRYTFLPIATLQSMKVVYFQAEASSDYRKLLQFQNKMPPPNNRNTSVVILKLKQTMTNQTKKISIVTVLTFMFSELF